MNYSQDMLAQCVCTRVRTMARLVTKTYDDILRPTGLKASQLAVLAAVDALEAPSIAALSKTLCMDRTTLSRNLRPLVEADLVSLQEDGYGRSKAIKLTDEGKATLKEAFPLWRKAQEAVSGNLEKKILDTMENQLRHLTSAYV